LNRAATASPALFFKRIQNRIALGWMSRLLRYEAAFGILRKLRAGMVRPYQDRIGGKPGQHVEADETYVGGRTRGEGGASITRFLSPALSKSATASQGLRRISGRMAGTPDEFYPFNAFRSLLGIAADTEAPTFAELYSGDWVHPTCSGCLRLTG
jgi:hypothetical protein